MSARQSQHADHSYEHARHVGSADATPTATRSDAGPYAVPTVPFGTVDAMLIDAIRVAVGPYVPAPFRVAVGDANDAVVSTSSVATAVIADAGAAGASEAPPRELPWIDAFLDGSASDTIPAVPVTFAVPSPAVSIFSLDALRANEDLAATAPEVEADARGLFAAASITADETAVPAAAADSLQDVAADVSAHRDPSDATVTDADAHVGAEDEALGDQAADEWPLAEAGAAMAELANGLAKDAHAPGADATSIESSESTGLPADATPAPEPMTMWGDEDLMDIMPVRRMRTAATEGEPWADQARRQSETGGAEAAASVLESLARRVRDGELTLSGYSPDMGEPAALAAALAALLGVRR